MQKLAHLRYVARIIRRVSNNELRVDAQRTIAKILDSARVLLAENPKATMGEIADHAVVHRATLNRHFPSRDALVEAVLRELLDTLDERIAEADTERGTVRDALRRASLAWLTEGRRWRVARYAPLAEIPLSGAAPERVRGRMVALFERGQRDGSVRDDVPALTLHRAWVGLMVVWLAILSDVEPEQLADDIVELLLPSRPA